MNARPLALLAAGPLALLAFAIPVGASAPTADIGPEYSWPMTVEAALVAHEADTGAPIYIPATTFDSGTGTTGTGGPVEVEGQGPRNADLRLLSCEARDNGVPLPGVPRQTVTAFSWTPDYVAARLADGTCAVVS